MPCISEHPELIEFVEQQAALGADGAEFYTVVTAAPTSRSSEFFAGTAATGRSSRPALRVVADFGVALVPETWIIDDNGVVRARFVGEVTAESPGTAPAVPRGGAERSRRWNRQAKRWPGWIVLAWRSSRSSRSGSPSDGGPQTPEERITALRSGSPARLRRRERLRVAQHRFGADP